MNKKPFDARREFLSTTEIADMTGFSHDAILRLIPGWIVGYKLRVIRMSGRKGHLRIPVDDFNRMLKEMEVK